MHVGVRVCVSVRADLLLLLGRRRREKRRNPYLGKAGTNREPPSSSLLSSLVRNGCHTDRQRCQIFFFGTMLGAKRDVKLFPCLFLLSFFLV